MGVDPREPREPIDPLDSGSEDETIVDETRVREQMPYGEREVVEERRVRRRRDDLWPWLLALLLLVLAGLAALWYFTREETKTVPDVVGQPLELAVSRLQDEGFKTDISQGNDEAEPGTIFRQDPAGGDEAEEGSDVQIVVSEGPEMAQVPAVVGSLEDDARDQLEDAGFDVTVVRVFSDEQEGSVVAQAPTGLDEAEVGSTVRINVSKGTGRVEVPNLVGLSEDEAEDELEQRDLRANVVEVPSDEQAGTVVAQNPLAGVQAQVDSTVRLNVSRGTGDTTETETEP
jgi:eukaryotic-like serine/threonine-protein kinase